MSLKASLTEVQRLVTAYNFAEHLKALRWRTPFQAICNAWAKDPTIFKIDPHHLIPSPAMATDTVRTGAPCSRRRTLRLVVAAAALGAAPVQRRVVRRARHDGHRHQQPPGVAPGQRADQRPRPCRGGGAGQHQHRDARVLLDLRQQLLARLALA